MLDPNPLSHQETLVCFIFIFIQLEIFYNLWRLTNFYIWSIYVLFNCQTFMYGPIIFLLIPRLVPLWSENMPFVISVIWGLSWCLSWPKVCKTESWWVFYEYLKRRRLLLLLVLYKCKSEPLFTGFDDIAQFSVLDDLLWIKKKKSEWIQGCPNNSVLLKEAQCTDSGSTCGLCLMSPPGRGVPIGRRTGAQ